MVLSLYSLLEASLLVINAIAILNEERFLVKPQPASPYGGYNGGGGGGGGMTPKMQMLNLLHSIRTVARVPLIAINIVVIIFKLIFG